MATEQPALDPQQKEKLIELFHILDADGSGKLDVHEFKSLGRAMTGQEPTDEQTMYQIKRADADNDGQLDEEEWLTFSQMLARLPRDMFFKALDTYIAKVRHDRS